MQGRWRAVLGSAALVIGIVGCEGREGGGDGTPRDSAGVSIVESARPQLREPWRLADAPAVQVGAGGADGPSAPLSVAGDRRGRILVADGGGQSVLVYDAEGALLFRAGGPAGGGTGQAGAAAAEPAPGTFARLWWVAPYRGDSLVAFDQGALKLVVFGPEGAFAREAAIPIWRREGPRGLPGYAAGATGPMDDGYFLTYPVGSIDMPEEFGPTWYRHELLRVAPDGAEWDTLGEFGVFQTWLGPSWTEPYPYAPMASRAPFRDGFVFTSGKDFEVHEHDRTGALLRILRRSHTPRPVTPQHLETYRGWFLERTRSAPQWTEEAEAEIARQLGQARHPEHLPAISQLLVDDEGYVWAEEFRWMDPGELAPEPLPTNWSVFGPDGRWLTRVEVPAGFLVGAVAGGRVYGIAVGADGARSVRVYPLIRP